MQADIAVHELMKVEQAANPERRDLLLALLEIDPEWRMHQVSDGMRRRVQIFLQLLSPYPIVLLDEITVDLDVITRSDFLDFLKVRRVSRGGIAVWPL
jgi:CCR4-NOT complex subunit CAF16